MKNSAVIVATRSERDTLNEYFLNLYNPTDKIFSYLAID